MEFGRAEKAAFLAHRSPGVDLNRLDHRRAIIVIDVDVTSNVAKQPHSNDSPDPRPQVLLVRFAEGLTEERRERVLFRAVWALLPQKFLSESSR